MNLFQVLCRRLLAPAGRGRRANRPIARRPQVRSREDRTLMSAFAVVTTTAKSGPGSLRAAITRVDASTSTSQLEIDFNIPTTDPGYNATTGQYTIKLTAALPGITHPAFLNGASEPGFAGSPLVALRGTGTVTEGLAIDATAGTFSSFAANISSLEFDQFSADALQVNNAKSATAMQVVLQNNQVTDTAGGDGFLVYAGSNSTAVTFQQNTIDLGLGGDGIVVHTAGNTTSLTLTRNRLTCRGGGNGVRVLENGTSADTLTFTGNRVTCNTGGDDVHVSGTDQSNTIHFSNNTLKTGAGGDALISGMSSSSLTSWTIRNNAFDTSGQGDGLNLVGGATFQALVQGNKFTGNKVGVQVSGDGTTAGPVDLGGGSLGSTGGNDFSAFTTATARSYAIGLFDVSSSYTMDAQSNSFSVSPTSVIADGSHDPAAHGSGVIQT
jgi:hypothetical protein